MQKVSALFESRMISSSPRTRQIERQINLFRGLGGAAAEADARRFSQGAFLGMGRVEI